ncbi:THUMP domain-containing class I SAM-dependent RNA methyltransferase [Lacticaseibacillus pantheris]|uniref:THUMP domain-containing class I SAM-dependent RNA methyltransferase n=1 Tax=Lacticaseibacillus pantheris TaxID=171523 RepID=UPI00265AAC40|nr:class I SAM-dependent RNA methyltransferase [Lacticaseibacillus pantheris]WKF84381.1 class I SAM-dependent RNA methyltransferase [Lacticaseibacillus pantheris]
MQFKLMATMAAGLEAVTAKELQQMGYKTQTENGRVYFEGDETDIVRTNVWLRSADRIKIILKQFKALTFDDLFEGVKSIPWADYLPLDAAFPVAGRAVRSKLHSEPDVQAITKKAVVESMATTYHRHSRLPETGNKYQLEVSILKDIATITIDTTGSSLFKRGYRVAKGPAPLKENFAAALVLLTNWRADMPFYDPTTGSGTIAIEAAMIARNMAPGRTRDFAFSGFSFMDPQLLDQERERAMAAITNPTLTMVGGDINQEMIDIARVNAQNAGVLHDIQFKQVAVKDFRTDLEDGVIIANPPYGKRLQDADAAQKIAEEMGAVYGPLTSWSKYILSGDANFERYYGHKATKRRKLYNGAMRVDLYQYWGRRPRH